MIHRSKQYLIDDLSIHESWRLFKIMSEIVDGFENLSEIGPAVSMFGSARVKPEDPLYLQTVELSKALSEAGFSIITGGGPGLMEAGNKGAFENGGESIGLHIHLPMEQQNNPYMNVKSEFRYFFIRKLMFIKYALAYVALPGGYGTLDELSEALVLIQTHRIKTLPHRALRHGVLVRVDRLVQNTDGDQQVLQRGRPQSLHGHRRRERSGQLHQETRHRLESDVTNSKKSPSLRPGHGGHLVHRGLGLQNRAAPS